jgi:flagellar biogenesis protein FliO
MLNILLAHPAETHLAGSAPDLTRYLFVVGVLIVALVGIAWGFRRLIAGSLKTRASGRSLAVIDVLPLGGKRQLTVVRCYDRTFALGLGEKDVTLVAELDPVVAGKDGGQSPTGDGRTREFEGLLDKARSRLTQARRTLKGEPRETTTKKELVG